MQEKRKIFKFDTSAKNNKLPSHTTSVIRCHKNSTFQIFEQPNLSLIPNGQIGKKDLKKRNKIMRTSERRILV